MKKLTIELTSEHSRNCIPCSFCGGAESDHQSFSILNDDKETNWDNVCLDCFQLLKTNPSALFEKAANTYEADIKSKKQCLETLKYLSSQKIEAVNLNFLLPFDPPNPDPDRYYDEIMAEEDEKFGDAVICTERCENCDGDPGERHLPQCVNMDYKRRIPSRYNNLKLTIVSKT